MERWFHIESGLPGGTLLRIRHLGEKKKRIRGFEEIRKFILDKENVGNEGTQSIREHGPSREDISNQMQIQWEYVGI